MTTALNIYAHLPDVDQNGQYRLSSGLDLQPDDIWFNGQMPDGTLTAVAEPEGWEGLTYVTPIDTAGGRDGGLLGPGSVAPRQLPVSGLMVAPDAVTLRRNIALLRTKLRPRMSVVWDQYDFGEQVRMGIVCRATGDFKATPVKGHQPGGVAAPFSFTLIAANPPWKLATGTATERCMELPISAVTGRTYNKTYNWNYGAVTNPGGFMNVMNQGNLSAWPVFTITGPVDNPVITNETTGQGFVLTSSVPAGQTVTVDARTGVVTPSSYRIAGRPFPLAPGNNTLRWRATSGTYTPDASLCVTWRSTWE